ncbi:Protein C13G5.2 [Aphelenchoides avenae]|nr:Protein C13G5.2 [Aphelenchus avenae]
MKLLLLLLVIGATSVVGREGHEDESTGFDTLKAASGGVAGVANSPLYVKAVSGDGSTVLKVVDAATNKWAIRVDKPHAGAAYNHINVNKAVSGMKDPHIPVSDMTLAAAKGVNSVIEAIKKVEPFVKTAVYVADAYQVADAVYSDYKARRCPRRTLRTAGRVGGSYGGLYVGAKVGGSVGSTVGGIVGGLFGGVGAVPGAAIGGWLGSFVGGYSGMQSGASVGEGVGHAIGDELCDDYDYEYRRRRLT